MIELLSHSQKLSAMHAVWRELGGKRIGTLGDPSEFEGNGAILCIKIL
jgi:hypothetical protein